MLTRNVELIKRLNILLELPKVDIHELGEAGWSALLDDLHWAILGDKRHQWREDVFHQAATPDAIRAAQDGLRGQFQQLRHPKVDIGGPLRLDDYPSFNLNRQTVYLLAHKDGFVPRYVSTDFPTMAYQSAIFLIDRLGLHAKDFLRCDYEKCGRVFVPLRKPHAGAKQHFCSGKCGRIVSARASRLSKQDRAKAAERERSHRNYKKRVEKRTGKPTRVKRRPRLTD